MPGSGLPSEVAEPTVPAIPSSTSPDNLRRMSSKTLLEPEEEGRWFSTPHALVFLVLWTVVQAVLFMIQQPEPLMDTQIDPDGYMRLVRVGMLLDGGGWFDAAIPRSNWPYGEAHHWTRPLDVLIIALTLPLRVFLDASTALAVAGMFVSPLCHVALCIASVWMVRPLVHGPERHFAMPAMLAPLGILLYGQAGRADHHAMIFLMAGLALGAWIRVLLRPEAQIAAILAGVFSGLGIWISPESLLPLGLLFASGGAAWILGGSRFLAPNRRLCLGLAGALALAMVLERPPSDWFGISFDRISLAHLTMSFVALGFWWVIGLSRERAAGPGDELRDQPISGGASSGWKLRFIQAGGGLLIAAGLLRRVHPGFFKGPWVDVDPEVVDVWLAHVQELQPLYPRAGTDIGPCLMHLGPALFLVPLLVRWLWREWRTPRRTVWIHLFLSLLVYIPLAALQIRFSAYAGMVFAVVSVEAVSRILNWTEERRHTLLRSLVRVGGIAILLVGHLLIGLAVHSVTQGASRSPIFQEPDAAQDDCSLTKLTRFLADPNDLAVTPLTIAAFIDFGPELLYRTPHRVLAGPYHRNYHGIVDAYRFLTSDAEEGAWRLAFEREIDLVLLCPPIDRYYFGRGGAGTLYSQLLEGDGPVWINRIPLPSDAPGGFLLFRVEREDAGLHP